LLLDIEDWNGEDNIYSLEEKVILRDIGSFASIEEKAKKLDEIYRNPVFLVMNTKIFLDTESLPSNSAV